MQRGESLSPTSFGKDAQEIHPHRQQVETQNSFVLPGTTKHCTTALTDFLNSIVRIYECSFKNFLDDHLAFGGEPSLEDNVQFILTDPPFNCRQERGDETAKYNKLTLEDMQNVVNFTANLLRKGGHALIFCSAQQLKDRSRLFSSHSFFSCRGHKKQTFMVSQVPDMYIYHPSYSKNFPGRKSCARSSASNMALHVQKNGLPLIEEEKW